MSSIQLLLNIFEIMNLSSHGHRHECVHIEILLRVQLRALRYFWLLVVRLSAYHNYVTIFSGHFAGIWRPLLVCYVYFIPWTCDYRFSPGDRITVWLVQKPIYTTTLSYFKVSSHQDIVFKSRIYGFLNYAIEEFLSKSL